MVLRTTSYAANKEDLLLRLRKLEGQVRGIQMIAEDRYCLEVVQQVNALTAGAQAVALKVLEDHLRSCVREAVTENNADAAIKEMMVVLAKTFQR